MITKRKLIKWRKEALQDLQLQADKSLNVKKILTCNKILEMTQELIDQHLLKEAK